jgi:hypothetical protein
MLTLETIRLKRKRATIVRQVESTMIWDIRLEVDSEETKKETDVEKSWHYNHSGMLKA